MELDAAIDALRVDSAAERKRQQKALKKKSRQKDKQHFEQLLQHQYDDTDEEEEEKKEEVAPFVPSSSVVTASLHKVNVTVSMFADILKSGEKDDEEAEEEVYKPAFPTPASSSTPKTVYVPKINEFYELVGRRVGIAKKYATPIAKKTHTKSNNDAAAAGVITKEFVDKLITFILASSTSSAHSSQPDEHEQDRQHEDGRLHVNSSETSDATTSAATTIAPPDAPHNQIVPTPVQAVTWDLLFVPSAPDLIAVSSTGSGKTLAFLIPIIARAMASWSNDNSKSRAVDIKKNAGRKAATECYARLCREGISAVQAKEEARKAYAAAALVAANTIASPEYLIVSPTRELCQQTGEVCALLLQHLALAITSMVVIGGTDITSQRSLIMDIMPVIVVATPGRLLGLCGRISQSTRTSQMQKIVRHDDSDVEVACSLHNVCTFVLDEADRLLDLGFEEDLRSIGKLLLKKPDVWTMLFSATFPSSVRRLAASVVSPNAKYIAVGSDELTSAATVTQRVEMVLKGKGAPRFRRLCQLLAEFGVPQQGNDDDGDDDGNANANARDITTIESDNEELPKVLVFVLYKKEARDIAKSLADKGFSTMHLSGDMSQTARHKALQDFRDGKSHILVATDVAARGLDVSGITHVINFSLGMSIDTYVHRVGRCGRAGRTGLAHSFVIEGDERLLPELVQVLRRSGQSVPRDLTDAVVKYEHAVERQAQMGNMLMDEEAQLAEESRIENRERQLKLKALGAQKTKNSKFKKKK
eukprot:m.137343 g.137343  ORF g.137343 m.137343 type:complete len:760 (+) comp29915_c0_seq2:282-2561(+)